MEFEKNFYQFHETDRNAKVALTAQTDVGAAKPTQDVAVTVRSGALTATPGRDYESVNETLTFRAADFTLQDGRYVRRVELPLVLINDVSVEKTEAFDLAIESSGLPAHVSVGYDDETVIHILSRDDQARVSVSAPERVREGELAIVTLTVDKTVEFPIAVVFTTQALTAQENVDYVRYVEGVQFAERQRKLRVRVRILDDDLVEDDEQFQVQIVGNTLDDNTLLGETIATMTIIDTDSERAHETIWNATLTAGSLSQTGVNYRGYDTSASFTGSGLSTKKFSYGGTEYTVSALWTSKTTATPSVSRLGLRLNPTPSAALRSRMTLVVEPEYPKTGTEANLGDAPLDEDNYMGWPTSVAFDAGETRQVSIRVTGADPTPDTNGVHEGVVWRGTLHPQPRGDVMEYQRSGAGTLSHNPFTPRNGTAEFTVKALSAGDHGSGTRMLRMAIGSYGALNRAAVENRKFAEFEAVVMNGRRYNFASAATVRHVIGTVSRSPGIVEFWWTNPPTWDASDTAGVDVFLIGKVDPAGPPPVDAGDPLTGRFIEQPRRHNGGDAFTALLWFSEHVTIGAGELLTRVLSATNATITEVRVSKDPEGRDRADLWEVSVEPHNIEELKLWVTPRRGSCIDPGTICGHTGKKLTEGFRRTIGGPVLSVNNASATEGDDATLDFTVRLDPGAATVVTVEYATSDDGSDKAATAGLDYTATSGTLTFAVGETSKTVSVPIIDDTVEDDRETFKITLSNPSGAAIRDGEGRGTIRNTEAPAANTFTATFKGMPSEHDGANPFTFRTRFSAAPGVSFQTIRDAWFAVTGGTVTKAKRVEGSNVLREIHVQPAGNADVTVTLEGGRDCSTSGAICTGDGKKLAHTVTATVQGPPAISVADARVEEASGATLDFAVTLSRAPFGTVTVDYATSDGTATAAEDYTATSGTLTFAAGETSKIVAVPVLDDAHDEDEETLTLTLSNPSGGYIADGTATGTIENSDPMPQAWLARFGRTVTDQVLEAVSERIAGPRAAGFQGSVGGQPVSFGGGAVPQAGAGAGHGLWADDEAEAAAGLEALTAWVGGEDGVPGGGRPQEYTLTGRELFLGSSFSLTGGSAEGGYVAAWGRMAVSGFDGREEDLTLDGEVVTGMLGADFAAERWKAGLVVSRSEGDGGYDSPEGRGEVSSTLTALHPWGSLQVSQRLSLWAAAGYGEGTLDLTPEGMDAIGTDMSYRMGAGGLVSELLEPGREDGARLALRTDARFTTTSSEAADGMAAAEADTWLLGAGLEGSRRFALGADGAAFVPSFEVGLRRDGGDAETGFGADVGGGLAFSAPASGLSVDMSARGLLAHEASGFREWGASAGLGYDPDPSPHGLTASLRQTWGAASAGGADALLGRSTMAGLEGEGDNGGGFDPQRRLEATLGYGMSVFGGGLVGTAELGLGLSESGRDYRLGWRLGLADSARVGFDLNLEATRREAANDDRVAEHGAQLKVNLRW